MLRMSCDSISHILASIFNASLTEDICPNTWKTAIVVPVFKKGNIYDTNNFRLILLQCLTNKFFEKIVCRQLNDYLESVKSLSPTQHGYCKRCSCEMELIRLTNLLFSTRHKQHMVLVTTDFSKAFDSINFYSVLWPPMVSASTL